MIALCMAHIVAYIMPRMIALHMARIVAYIMTRMIALYMALRVGSQTSDVLESPLYG
jgi:hypothetical protein